MKHLMKTLVVSVLVSTSTVMAQTYCHTGGQENWRISVSNQLNGNHRDRAFAREYWSMNEYLKHYVFRGQTFKCTATAPQTCSYAWGQSKSTSITWNINLQAGLAGSWNNFLGLIGGNFGYTYTTTTTFNWTINLAPGQFAYPAQYVNRQRYGGWIQGGWYKGGACSVTAITYDARGNPTGSRRYTGSNYTRNTGYNDVWQAQRVRGRASDGSTQAIGVYIINGRE